MNRKTSIRNWTILLGSSLTVMAGTTIAPSLPEMSAVFQDLPNAQFLVQLVLTIPALLIAATAIIFGYLVDKVGRRPILIFSVLLYGIAGTSGYFLESLTAILVGRALLGLAVAGLMIGFTTLIADYFTGDERNKFMGYQAAVMAIGGVVFLLLGGVLADIGWRFPFLIYFFAFLIFPAVLYSIKEQRSQPEKEKLEESENNPNLDLKGIAVIYLIGFLGMLVFSLGPIQLPFYLTNLTNASNSLVGATLAAQTGVAALFSLQYQRVKGKLSYLQVAILVFLAFGIGYSVIGFSSTYLPILLGLLISGIGLGLLLPTLNLWLVSIVPAALRGRAVGGMTTFVFIGQFLTPIAAQPITARVGPSGTFLAGGGFLLLLAGLLYLSTRRISMKK